MKKRWASTLGFAGQFALTAAIAFIGYRLIPHFDIRGPFLVMSPLFALGLVGWAIGCFFSDRFDPGETPKAENAKRIQEVALEFGFGQVTVLQKSTSSGPVLSMRMENEPFVNLPSDWLNFEISAQRFAVVRSLAIKNEKTFFRNCCYYLGEIVAMFIAGLNLWTIIAIHSLAVGAFVYAHVIRSDRAIVRQDLAALRIMKDLKAAISYVNADKTNGFLFVQADRRIEALRREAARLSIA